MSATAPGVYSVAAYNTAKSSENKIHDDTVARRFGFRGGLGAGGGCLRLHDAPARGALGPRLARAWHRGVPVHEAGLRRQYRDRLC